MSPSASHSSKVELDVFPFSRVTFRRLCAVGAIAATLLLGGCGSARPPKYYQLTVPPVAASTAEPLPVSLMVRTFETSHLYREDRIVYGSEGQQVGVYENQRWVAPPTELLQDAIVRGLRSSGRFLSVTTARGYNSGDYVLIGHLYEFKEVDAAGVVARLSYDVQLRDRRTSVLVWKSSYSHDEPCASKDVPAVAAAMDKNVQASVQQLQAGLEQFFHSQPPK